MNASTSDEEALDFAREIASGAGTILLGFLEKLTLDPEGLTADDIAPLREQGVSDEAIEDAIVVATAFNGMDRLADNRSLLRATRGSRKDLLA